MISDKSDKHKQYVVLLRVHEEYACSSHIMHYDLIILKDHNTTSKIICRGFAILNPNKLLPIYIARTILLIKKLPL